MAGPGDAKPRPPNSLGESVKPTVQYQREGRQKARVGARRWPGAKNFGKAIADPNNFAKFWSVGLVL